MYQKRNSAADPPTIRVMGSQPHLKNLRRLDGTGWSCVCVCVCVRERERERERENTSTLTSDGARNYKSYCLYLLG